MLCSRVIYAPKTLWSLCAHPVTCARRPSYATSKLAAYRPTFLLSTVFMLFCMGGNFAMFPAQTFRTFGAMGPSVYSFLFTGFGCAALLGPMLSTALLAKGDYTPHRLTPLTCHSPRLTLPAASVHALLTNLRYLVCCRLCPLQAATRSSTPCSR